MTALKAAVALLFRRAGENELSEEAIVRQASLDLHWFSPKDARRFVEAASAMGYLEPGSRAGSLRPAFPVAEVEVSLDFRVDAHILDAVGAGPAAGSGRSSVADELVAKAAAARGAPLEDVWRDVQRKQEQVLVEAPVAAALVAAEAGVDVRPFAARVKHELAALSRGATPSAS